MIYFSEHELDQLLLEDIYRGDLTTQTLGLNNTFATIQFTRKNAGIIAGIRLVQRLCQKLDLIGQAVVQDGEWVSEGSLLFQAQGRAEQVHQLWKVAQLVLEWSCGVAQYTAQMVANARQIEPNAIVACTRKSIPYTRKLATMAVLAGGGHIHRQGISESLLVFTNHRNLLEHPNDYQAIVAQLRQNAPEHKITLEADNLTQFSQILQAHPDIIQLDKFSLTQVQTALTMARDFPLVQLSVAGGVNRDNVAHYAKLGIRLFITSAPYYAQPEDIKVQISPLI